MNQAARGIGRTLTLVLPVVLVLSGTLAVSQVPWSEPPSATTVMAAGTERTETDPAAQAADSPAPEDLLLEDLLTELLETDPGAALTSLQRAVERAPSLAAHCADLAHALGQAAVEAYGGAAAQEHARPVCDTSFAGGITETVEAQEAAALS